MFIISSIVTVANGGSNDINDIVSIWERGRTFVDLREIVYDLLIIWQKAVPERYNKLHKLVKSYNTIDVHLNAFNSKYMYFQSGILRTKYGINTSDQMLTIYCITTVSVDQLNLLCLF